MGNDSSVLVKHRGLIGPSRKMSKAQSSSLLADIREMNRSQEDGRSSLNSPISLVSPSTTSSVSSRGDQRRQSGVAPVGGYIKKREQQQQQGTGGRRKAMLVESLSGRAEKLQQLAARRTPSRALEQQEEEEKSGGSSPGDESTSGGEGGGGGSPSFDVIAEETPVLNAKNGGMHHQQHHGGAMATGTAKSWVAAAKHGRKDSAGWSESAALPNGTITAQQQQLYQQKRHRSASLCPAQMKAADCQAIAALSYQHALNGGGAGGGGGRKASLAVSAHPGVMPSLTRLRIQQGFRNAKPAVGHQILKRACTLRSEFKSFLGHLREDKAEELAMDIYKLVTECVANVELPSKVAATAFAFGEMHAQLCNSGFRPDFFSVIADATIAECVRLDGAQKRCETLMAWSQLMQFMFSNVRDGYYAEVRQQRRSSLPQQRLLLKQASIAAANKGGGAGEAIPLESGGRKATMLQQGISFDMNI